MHMTWGYPHSTLKVRFSTRNLSLTSWLISGVLALRRARTVTMCYAHLDLASLEAIGHAPGSRLHPST
ncbi:hypothetical protein PM082_006965 [Marasmius tenuissimus]|nr:hypothetical protein PM082_006965 [Marasmius tenuissimus]